MAEKAIMKTDALIRDLSNNLQPVQPLQPPLIRTLKWLAPLLPYSVAAVLLIHFLGKLPSPTVDLRFTLEQVFAVLTGLTAAAAAFASVVPGRSRSYLFWPLLPLAGWAATLGEGCIHNSANGFSLHHNLLCFPYIVILGTPPAVLLWAMLRRGAPLAPRSTAALGAIAAAGLGNFCVRLVHAEDVSVMLVVWHMGGILLLTGIASMAGDHFLDWRKIARPVRP
jgi:hypothetical protein